MKERIISDLEIIEASKAQHDKGNDVIAYLMLVWVVRRMGERSTPIKKEIEG